MRERKLLGIKASGLEQGDSNCIAHGHCSRRARGRCEVEWAGFASNLDQNMHIGLEREGRLRIAGHGNKRCTAPLK